MFKNLSPQSKSFLILFAVALVGTYLTTMVVRHSVLLVNTGPGGYDIRYYPQNTAQAQEPQLPTVSPVDTSSWKTYTDQSYPLSFKYDPSWKVSVGKTTTDGFYQLQIDPGSKYYNMHVYISPSKYFALDSLPGVPATVSGLPALTSANILFGVKYQNNYYTFDCGLSTNLIDQFNALVQSAKFQ